MRVQPGEKNSTSQTVIMNYHFDVIGIDRMIPAFTYSFSDKEFQLETFKVFATLYGFALYIKSIDFKVLH